MEEKEIAIIENSFGSGYIDCSDNSFDEEYQAFKKLYSEHKNIKQQNKELQDRIDKATEYIKGRIQCLEVSYSKEQNDEYLNAKLFGGKKELELFLSILDKKGE